MRESIFGIKKRSVSLANTAYQKKMGGGGASAIKKGKEPLVKAGLASSNGMKV